MPGAPVLILAAPPGKTIPTTASQVARCLHHGCQHITCSGCSAPHLMDSPPTSSGRDLVAAPLPATPHGFAPCRTCPAFGNNERIHALGYIYTTVQCEVLGNTNVLHDRTVTYACHRLPSRSDVSAGSTSGSCCSCAATSSGDLRCSRHRSRPLTAENAAATAALGTLAGCTLPGTLLSTASRHVRHTRRAAARSGAVPSLPRRPGRLLLL